MPFQEGPRTWLLYQRFSSNSTTVNHKPDECCHSTAPANGTRQYDAKVKYRITPRLTSEIFLRLGETLCAT